MFSKLGRVLIDVLKVHPIRANVWAQVCLHVVSYIVANADEVRIWVCSLCVLIHIFDGLVWEEVTVIPQRREVTIRSSFRNC